MTSSPVATDSKGQATTISNAIGSLHRQHYGRGADRIRTTISRDLVATMLEDCFTTVEKTMISEGQFAKVRETRILFPDWMGPAYVQAVEETTGRTARAFFSQVSADPDSALEFFLLEPSASTDGAGDKVATEAPHE